MEDISFLGEDTNVWGHDGSALMPLDTDPFGTSYYDMNLFSCPELPLVGFELPQMGDEPLVQTFFEGPKKCNCCTNWVERQPVEIPKQAQEKYQKAAIRIYKCKDHHGHDANGPKPSVMGGLTAVTFSYIEIQSPIIRREIGRILAEYGLETLSTETIKISQPFKELYFAHCEILGILKKQEPGTKEKEHIQVLVDVLKEIFAEMMPEVSSLHTEKKISFKYLWTIFPKNIIVYSNQDGQDRLYEVVTMLETSVKCRYVEFDGLTFGWSTTEIPIHPFVGIQKISNLPVYPVGFHIDKGLEERLVIRGSKVLEYQDIVHCDYHEISSSQFSGTICGIERVVVDVFGYQKCRNTRIIVEKLQDEESKSAQKQNATEIEDVKRGIKLTRRLSAGQREENKARFRKRRQWLLLLSPTLRGFSFTKNRWEQFCVDNLGPISWNTEALDRLVFPESHKDLILAFVTNYGQSISHSDDVINGKGQGLVVLLSGPPGTGKTSTVEAIAEKTKRPLYRIGAQGTNVYSLTDTLSMASVLSKEYGAVLLLDEADVFLHRRSVECSDRNIMVADAEMLRELEYYVGIIFLTTNLLQDVDQAFLSRIHMHFKYPSLSVSSRLKIWKDILSAPANEGLQKSSNSPGTDKSGWNHSRTDMSDEDLNVLASWKLNGREIKNVVKVARLWCRYNHYPLTRNELETVIDTTAPAAGKEDIMFDREASPRKRARVE